MKNNIIEFLKIWGIFTIGLIFGALAIVLANNNALPFIDKVLAKDLVEMRKGYEKLNCLGDFGKKKISDRMIKHQICGQGGQILRLGDDGFYEIIKFAKQDINKENPEAFAETWSGNMSFDDARAKMNENKITVIRFSGVPDNSTWKVPKSNNKFNIYFEGKDCEHCGNYVSFYMYVLEGYISKRFEKRYFTLAIVVFFISSFIQALAIYKKRES